MRPKIRQWLNRLRYLSIRKKLKGYTSGNIYVLLLSTHPYCSSAGDRALNILTPFADTWENLSVGHNAVRVGIVILNRAFQITISRTTRWDQFFGD
jgi:hypothetical protein